MQQVFINITGKSGTLNSYYQWSFRDIIQKYQLIVIHFYKIDPEVSQFSNTDELESNGIIVAWYTDFKDLHKQIFDVYTRYKILYINTFSEVLIPRVNLIKKDLGQQITQKPKLFRNKKIQRQLLRDAYEEITINYIKSKYEKLDIEKIEKKIGYPFILKPVAGVGSLGVFKIHSRNEYDEALKCEYFKDGMKILIEEFITWKLFSVDYFVDESGKIHMTKHVDVLQGVHLWIDDFFHYSSSISCIRKKSFSEEVLKKFVEKTIEATSIRNTFVHHEFKYTDKWEFKTIELNGRIGWYRLEMYQQSLDLNLLELTIWKNINTSDLSKKSNFWVFSVYPPRDGIMKWYNHELIKKIKELPSFYSAQLREERHIGHPVGLTKSWFRRVAGLKIKHQDDEQFRKDFDFIEAHYTDLIFLEDETK